MLCVCVRRAMQCGHAVLPQARRHRDVVLDVTSGLPVAGASSSPDTPTSCQTSKGWIGGLAESLDYSASQVGPCLVLG